MKVFVVDDSQVDRKLLVGTLKKAGIENDILEADDGQAALDIIATEGQNMCLAILDWQLPKVDGLEILKRMARDPKTESLPIIMLTSATSPETEEIAELLNPNLKAFVMKPLKPEKIVEAVLPYIK